MHSVAFITFMRFWD